MENHSIILSIKICYLKTTLRKFRSGTRLTPSAYLFYLLGVFFLSQKRPFFRMGSAYLTNCHLMVCCLFLLDNYHHLRWLDTFFQKPKHIYMSNTLSSYYLATSNYFCSYFWMLSITVINICLECFPSANHNWSLASHLISVPVSQYVL